MKVSKRQLRKIIQEERARLLSEQLTDGTDWQDLLAKHAAQVSTKFGDDMDILFDEDPEAFAGRSTREQWSDQVHNAMLELDTGLVAAMEDVIAEIESRLHGGDFSDDAGGPSKKGGIPAAQSGRGYTGA
jgi:hypothetical protein